LGTNYYQKVSGSFEMTNYLLERKDGLILDKDIFKLGILFTRWNRIKLDQKRWFRFLENSKMENNVALTYLQEEKYKKIEFW